MTPTPEICKNCRHQSPVFKQLPILLDCRVWKITVPEYHSCQHFESREKEKPKTETLWLYPGVAR